MPFFFLDDFERELKEFNVTERHVKEQVRVDRQIGEFVKQYPLSRVKLFSVADFFNSHVSSGDNFWCWVAKKTNAVGGSIPWSAAKFNFDRRYLTAQPLQDRFDTDARMALVEFIESKGVSCYDEVRHLVGSMIALRLLILYYPNEFVHIVRVGWIDRIVYSLKLDNNGSIIDRLMSIRRFYDEKSDAVRRIPMVAFVQLLDEYIGLSVSGNKKFYKYLVSEKGVSETAVAKYDRVLRKLSRQLKDDNYISANLYKVNSLDWFSQLLRDAGSIVNTDEYREPVRWYYKFLESQSNGKSSSGLHRTTGVFHRPVGRIVPFISITSIDSLVDSLKSAAKRRKFHRHYTTITSFLHITDMLAFRLTRGDDPRMNDQLEWQKLGSLKAWKRTFILSFSGLEDESAAMWGLYGRPSNEAMRLTIRRETIEKWFYVIGRNGQSVRAQLFPFVGEKGKMVDLPLDCIEIILVDVMYGGKVGGIEQAKRNSYRHNWKKVDLSFLNKNLEEEDDGVDKATEMTGLIKSNDWEYEDECRVIVRIKDGCKIVGIEDLDQIQYIYIPITKELLSECDLMVGPCVPDKLSPLFESKLKEEVPDISVARSKYEGNLIFK